MVAMNVQATANLAWTLAALGALGAAVGVGLWTWPEWLRRGAKAFPRCRWAGWGLAAACVVWIVALVRAMPLGMFEGLRPWIVPLGVALYAAVVWGIGELLAVRALGGLLLLAANPVLWSLRFATDPGARVWAWHTVAVAALYGAVAVGCVWLLRPWGFRRTGEWLAARPKIRRLAGAAAAMSGLAALAAAAELGWCP